MIDLHSHTLWGLDDGARGLEEAVEMCRVAAESGTKTLFVTPHQMYWDKAEAHYDIRNDKVEYLRNVLDELGIELDIKTGFEIYCDDEIFDVKYLKPYTLANSRYLLIEFEFFKTTEEDVAVWCSYILSRECVPIIAHPERYTFVQADISAIERLGNKGVLFQINAGSPAGFFGEESQVAALRLLNSGYADFVGSDAHRAVGRDTNMRFCFERYPERADMELLKKAACDNAECIINDEAFMPYRAKII